MKKFTLAVLLLTTSIASYAKHISGGEMSYVYLGPGSLPGTLKYEVTLKLYRVCDAPPDAALLDDFAVFTVFNTSNFAQIRNITNIPGSAIGYIRKIPDNPCIPDEIESAVCFQFRTYTTIIDNLPENARGYTVAYQRCCRIDGMENINSNTVGSTYFATIPGNQIPGAQTNTSPVFASNDAVLICSGRPITFDFHATDADGDSLTYQFYTAFTGGGAGGGTCTTCTTPNPAAKPPYDVVTYINGYSFLQPLGPQVTINSQTGLISGITPNLGPFANSIFAITVLVNEFRGGIKIGTHFKDLQIRVVDCQVTTATLNPRGTICNSLTVAFQNDASNNPEPSYFWDFGDPASGVNNTSTVATPTHDYLVAGTYTVKLVLNRGQACGDSTTTVIKVYPGFDPDFTVTGQCKNTAIQFKDITTAAFGVVDKWSWNFGDFSSPSNTSTQQNPTHSYATANTYNVQFTVSTSVGCSATVTKAVQILDKPPLTISGDTLICIIDTLQLQAVGTGSILWSPNYMISNVNIPNPLVSPDVTTTYTATITDPFGCVGSEDVTVQVKPFVTLFAPPDTTICQTDPVILRITSDALHYLWTETPAGSTLNNPTIKNPTATPLVTTTYHVVANIGKCVSQADIKVTPIPYPVPNAGPDLHICVGGSAQLHASGGSIYSWTPAAFLTATNIPNPVSVKPTDNVRYVVTVRDVLGCPKPVRDTVIVFVDKIIANAGPRDTSVVLGQPLQLGASGGTHYLWTPITWLSNPNINNPISLPQSNIEYVVRVSNDIGCFANDTILVRLFRLTPGFYVPNAFTPNGDGNNDIFRPIAIGMKSIDVFRVYNRWGQLVYSGSGNEVGWDGRFGGRPQEAATFVWYAEGVDYLNNKIKKKGTVILIR